jgi:hypothetical protein
MNLYIDKLPRDCKQCKYCWHCNDDDNNLYCFLLPSVNLPEMIEPVENYDKKTLIKCRDKKCPLRSTADLKEYESE